MLKSNKNTLTRYPFEFELYTTYRLDENKLTTIYKVINTGKSNMPFCIGGHPAFKIDYESLKNGDYYLEFDSVLLPPAYKIPPQFREIPAALPPQYSLPGHLKTRTLRLPDYTL